MSQGLSHLLPNAQYFGFSLCLIEDVVVRLDYDEHVVNADTEADEGKDGVHGRVGEAQEGAESHADDHSHSDTEKAGDGEVESDVDEVGVTEHDDRVDKHNQVTAGHEECVEEYGLATDLAKALG